MTNGEENLQEWTDAGHEANVMTEMLTQQEIHSVSDLEKSNLKQNRIWKKMPTVPNSIDSLSSKKV